jgi:uncharacterized membrane protein
MRARLSIQLERLRSAMWPIPAAMVALATLLAWATLAIDHDLRDDVGPKVALYGGDALSARSLLSAIATALLTFTGLVFSVTMLVLQLASSQLSPRVMRTFLQDRGNQAVLGVFVSTLVYSLLVLRAVRSPPDAFVPGLSIWVAIVLLLGSVGAFIYYIHHMANAIRATQVMDRVAGETRASLDATFPDAFEDDLAPPPAIPGGPPSLVVRAERSGIVGSIDAEALAGLAADHQATLEVSTPVGGWVPESGPLVRLWTQERSPPERDIRAAIPLASERSMAGDPAFGFRQLVDIAIRALSPSVNDPTTAIQGIDRIHALLRLALERRIPARERRELDRGRVIVPHPTWDDLVALAVDEIALFARDMPRVGHRLAAMLDDLLDDAPPSRQPVLRNRRSSLDGTGPVGPDAPTRNAGASALTQARR